MLIHIDNEEICSDALMEKINSLEQCLDQGLYQSRITLEGEDGIQLIGRPAALRILNEQEKNGLLQKPHPVMGKQLRIWTGLTKTKMALLTGMGQNIQWSNFESKNKSIGKEAWTLLLLRLNIHPKYKLVLKEKVENKDE